MKKYSIFLLLLFAGIKTFSQAGMWTWVSGTSLQNSTGNFGTKGVPSPTNHPPGLYEACEWTDKQGNFWLFGGSGNWETYNTLWKYEPLTNEWTWMKGDTVYTTGNFGTKGVPSPFNEPPSTGYASFSWTDTSGALWMLGGAAAVVFPLGSSNALWKYDITTNEWTWISGTSMGNDPGVYGVQGIPSINNIPPARQEGCTSWVDSLNNLWLFGGSTRNDLWRYNILNNEWTWMKGDFIAGTPSVSSGLGISDSINVPSGRFAYCKWKDNNGDFWLFGGQKINFGSYNDVWKYSVSTNLWTWIAGTDTLNGLGNYGNTCDTVSLINFPSSRLEDRACWVDGCGNFWVYGGLSSTTGSCFNDLWLFDPLTYKFVLIYNGNNNSSYGTIGVPSITNNPGGRSGSNAFKDNTGNFYLFGGLATNPIHYCGDLWKFVPDPSCVPNCPPAKTIAAFNASDTIFCEKKCIDFFDVSSNNPTSWQWFFPGADTTFSTLQNPAHICYNSFGSFDVTLIACNAAGCDTLIIPDFINELPGPAMPIITISNDTLFSSPAFSYQWYFNSLLIPGATDSFYVFQQQGTYYIIVFDTNGCANSSGVLHTHVNEITEAGKILIYPNPSDGSFEMIYSTGNPEDLYNAMLYDVTGRILVNKDLYNSGRRVSFDIGFATNGIYFLQFNTKQGMINKKIVINHVD